MGSNYEIKRVFAFVVTPKRVSGEEIGCDGGPCDLNDGLGTLIQESIAAADFSKQDEIVFNCDGSTRTCPMRDAIIDCAFEKPLTAGIAASLIAEKLSASMDGRSSVCLLVVCVEADKQKRRVTLWIFPKDTAFRFSAGGRKSHIDVLNDVFSHSSRHRKAAMFEGHNNPTGFLDGRVTDHQLGSRAKNIADFWVHRFLDCSLSFTAELGTKRIAQAFRKTMDGTADPAIRESLVATMTALSQSNQKRWSAEQIASSYLTGPAKTAFLKSVGDETAQRATFDLDRKLYRDTLNFRVFELDTGVFVSSPFSEIEQSVKLTPVKGEAGKSKLKCEGVVASEKVRARHA